MSLKIVRMLYVMNVDCLVQHDNTRESVLSLSLSFSLSPSSRSLAELWRQPGGGCAYPAARGESAALPCAPVSSPFCVAEIWSNAPPPPPPGVCRRGIPCWLGSELGFSLVRVDFWARAPSVVRSLVFGLCCPL